MGINAKSSIKSSSNRNEVKHLFRVLVLLFQTLESADTGSNYLYAGVQRIILILFQNWFYFILTIYL